MKTTLIILATLFLFSCTNNDKKSIAQNDRLELIPEPDKELREEYYKQLQHDSLTSDTTQDEVFEEQLQLIEANVKRINEIKEWTSIEERNLEQSTEGGMATYYFQRDTLLKIAVIHFGETGKAMQEFYTKDGQLSFVLETSYTYNRPITWDSTAMRENNDTEVFDMDKSDIMEDRNYFDNGILIQQTNNQDCGAPFAADYLKRIEADMKSEFRRLKGSLKK